MAIERLVFNVRRHDGQWAVEHDGEYFGHSLEKDVAKAAANRRAREEQDNGKLCQVRIEGEHGFLNA